ncbi:MAG: ribbon-helix-helix domain-containing protein [Thermomicrobiales bacterium]|nr:ribbon-helix-helix domain-containing protein [Thermomicrobiales bacterium]
MSHRTQITLTDDQYERLLTESERTGLSIAELVRRSIDDLYPSRRSHSEFVAALNATFGIWSDREETAEEYVDRLRPGLGERLAKVS